MKSSPIQLQKTLLNWKKHTISRAETVPRPEFLGRIWILNRESFRAQDTQVVEEGDSNNASWSFWWFPLCNTGR